MEDRAGKIFDSLGADAVLTEQEDLRRYLTGFESSFGYVITDRNGTTFYTDSRYTEAAALHFAGTGINVKLYERGATPFSLIKGYKNVAVPLAYTYAPMYNGLVERGFRVTDSTDAFVKAMAVKDAGEISLIQQACDVADGALEDLYGEIKEGITENELAAKLEYLMRCRGASGTSFDTICAFGPGGSMPHYVPGNRKLRFGDIILIDYGCKVGGYCSDSTVTFLFGDDGKHGEFKKTYGRVLDAQKLVMDTVASGMTGKEADWIARGYLAKYGLDKYFTHSLGHGIGINIHEYPRLSMSGTDILGDGMVFSDEPGVYFEGEYGIRIEDSLVLENGRAKRLTHSDKNLKIL